MDLQALASLKKSLFYLASGVGHQHAINFFKSHGISGPTIGLLTLLEETTINTWVWGRDQGGTPHMKGVGMLFSSLRGVNFGFWSNLGCSGQNAIIVSREGLF